MLLEEDKRGILLESGTNEIEVMEFTINDSLYGINVAKVKVSSADLEHLCPAGNLRRDAGPGRPLGLHQWRVRSQLELQI